MFRSRDRGETWEDQKPGSTDMYGAGLVVKDGAVLIGLMIAGIHGRDAEGAAWTPRNTGLGDSTVQALGLAGNAVLAGTGQKGHLYRSTDWGAHWARLAANQTLGAVLHISAAGPRIHVSTSEGIWISPDDGATWSRVRPRSDDYEVRTTVLSGGFLFARTSNSIYRSPDSGRTWTRINPVTATAFPAFKSLDVYGSRILLGSQHLGLFQSPDNGATWTRDSTYFGTFRTSSIYLVLSAGNDWFAGTGRGILRSSDGTATWAPINRGIGGGTPSQLLDLAPGRLLAVHSGPHVSADRGDHWVPVHDAFPTNHGNIATLGPNLYTTSVGVLYRSLDQGKTWDSLSTGGKADAQSGVMAAGPDLYLVNRADRYRSVDSGRGWMRQTGLESVSFFRPATSGSYRYLGTSDGVFAQTGSGEAWAPLPGLRNKWVTELHAAGKVLVAGVFDGGLHRSTDGGTTWTTPLDSARYGGIREILAHGTRLYAGADSGLFLSRDTGATWTSIGEGLPRKAAAELLVVGDTLFAGVTDEGLWRTELPDGATHALGRAPRGRTQVTWKRDLRSGRAVFRSPAGSPSDATGRRAP